MSNLVYVEDVFFEFFELINLGSLNLQHQDSSAAASFYNTLVLGNQITINQANFLIVILKKYQLEAGQCGLDYSSLLQNPIWKNVFRKLDLSKKIWVEQTEEAEIQICLRFPYSLKDAFDKEIVGIHERSALGSWDSERRLRIFNVYDCNVVQLDEFVNRHDFEIDETFRCLVNQVEEIWSQHENLTPYSYVDGEIVKIGNGTETANEFFNKHFSNNIDKDLLLAKSMGYYLKSLKLAPTTIEKICSTDQNYFWLQSNQYFFEIFLKIGGTGVIVLDRNTKNIIAWMEQFVTDAEAAGISREDVKVCFRDSGDTQSGLNHWIKENKLGGQIGQAKLLIFLHKPAKWLFKDRIDVKIVAVNSFIPINEPLTQSWLESHYCVFYLGNIKPTAPRMKQIVNL